MSHPILIVSKNYVEMDWVKTLKPIVAKKASNTIYGVLVIVHFLCPI